MKVIYIESNDSEPVVKDIKGDLAELQSLVGGYIQVIYYHDVAIVCNEDGKFLGLKPNRLIIDRDRNLYDIICGPMLVTSQIEDESLTEEQIEKWKYVFSLKREKDFH